MPAIDTNMTTWNMLVGRPGILYTRHFHITKGWHRWTSNWGNITQGTHLQIVFLTPKSWPAFSLREFKRKNRQLFVFSLTKKQGKQRTKGLLLFSFFPIKNNFPLFGLDAEKNAFAKVFVLGHVHLGLKQQPKGVGEGGGSAFREPQNFMCSNLSKGDTLPWNKQQVCSWKWMVGRWSLSF